VVLTSVPPAKWLGFTVYKATNRVVGFA